MNTFECREYRVWDRVVRVFHWLNLLTVLCLAAIGLALLACRQGHRVRFYTVTQLVNELAYAQQEHQLPKFLERLGRHKLLVLDEFGYVPFSATGAQLLFQCCSALAEHVSLIITTNLPFSEWVQVLGDERLTSGLLDRLTFRSHIVEFVGESYWSWPHEM